MTETDPVSPAQSRAAHAYAEALLGPEVAGPAAEDALAAFRQTQGDDDTLLALTRLMTAVSLPDRSSPEDRRQAVWASIGSASHCTCREAAALLATRANNNIQPRESAALDEHLSGCADCRDLESRSRTADTAFQNALHPPTGGGFSVAGMPRAVYAAAAVLVAVIVAIVTLVSNGSGRHTPAAAAAVPTQTAQLVTTTVAKTAIKPAVHHTVIVRRKTVRHTPVVKKHVRHTPAKVTHTATVSTPVQTTPATTPTPSTPVTAPSTATASASTTGATKATSAAESTHAPSTAAQVSGSSSLPAESAPQQGIGSLSGSGN